MKRRFISLALILCIVMTFLPAAAAAGQAAGTDGVTVGGATLNSATPYLVGDAAVDSGTLGVNNCTAYFDANTKTLTLKDANIVSESVGIQADSLNLMLEGANTVIAATGSGILVSGALTINGGGSLNAVGGSSNSNSNDSYGINASYLNVRGGTIAATGGYSTSASYGIYGTNVVINGGAVTATGGVGGTKSCGIYGVNTTINAGTVTATGGYATGDSSGESSGIGGDKIAVNGGTVVAVGGKATGISTGICWNESAEVSGEETKVVAVGGSAVSSYGVYNQTSPIKYKNGLLVAKGDTGSCNGSNDKYTVYDNSRTYNVVTTVNGSINNNIIIGADSDEKSINDTTALSVTDTLSVTGFNVVLAGNTSEGSTNSFAVAGQNNVTINGTGTLVAIGGSATSTSSAISAKGDKDTNGKLTISGCNVIAVAGACVTSKAINVIKPVYENDAVALDITNSTVVAVGGYGSDSSSGNSQGINIETNQNNTPGKASFTNSSVTAVGGYGKDKSYGVCVEEGSDKTAGTVTITGGRGAAVAGSIGGEVTKSAMSVAPTINGTQADTDPIAKTWASSATPYIKENRDTSGLLRIVVENGADVTYQWYRNTENSVGGEKIIGACASAFQSPSTPGTTFYYCVVSGSGVPGGTMVSDIAGIMVNQSTPTVFIPAGQYSPTMNEVVTAAASGDVCTAENLHNLIAWGQTLTITDKASGAKLQFGTDALKGIDGQTSDGIKAEIKDVSDSYKGELEGKRVYSLELTGGGKNISEFGGIVTVTLPYKLGKGESAEDVRVWNITADDSLVELASTYDAETGLSKFDTTHFSLYAVGVEKEAHDETWENPYSDVSEDDWFYDDVAYASAEGLMRGTGEGTFDPHGGMTRAMAVTMLYRLAGEPETSGGGAFADVAGGAWYSDAVAWAAENGIASGFGDGTFGPEDAVTREQLAAIMYRYEQYTGGGFVGSWVFRLNYADASDVSDWAYEAVCWCTMNGIIEGDGEGMINPQGSAERSQAAAMFRRFCESMEE